jgi:protein ImuB
VLDGEGAKQAVVACNAAAAALGIAPGLGANAAQALVPGLELLHRQPQAEAALLERLARWATQFTPVVSLEPPAALLAEVRGSLGLFGGADALRERVLGDLAARGLEARAALAPTPRAALWLARAGLAVAGDAAGVNLPAIAARLPLSCLGWPPAVIERLVATGVRNVADLVRLPRDGFARRFGPELLDELDEAFGRRAQPRRRTVAPERFDERLELPAECASSAALWPACEHLLGRLQAFLRARAAGLRGLSVELGHRGLPSTRLALGLARPGADVEHLRLLLGERLERTPLPAPVVTLRLRSSVVAPVELREAGLFARLERDGDPAAAARLLERLRARLGHDAVFGVDLVAEHRPEAAWRIAEPVLPDAHPPRARAGSGSSACAAAGIRPGGAALCAASPTATSAAARSVAAALAMPDSASAHGAAAEVARGPHSRA